MFRLRLIRPQRALKPLPLCAVDAAFAVLLVLAFALGGRTALAGAPHFIAMIFPPDMMAAQARDEIPSEVVRLPLHDTVTALVPDGVRFSEAKPKGPPAIALVIDDLGEDLAGTDRALLLPPQVTLSFLPFAEASHWLAPSAIKRGHEVLVHMPMESFGGKNAGPMTLMLSLGPAEITRRLDWSFEQVPGFAGLNNHEGSRFTSDAAALVPVVKALAARGAYFFDSRTAATSQVVRVARAYGVPSAARDIFLDDTVSAQNVAKQLKALEAHARLHGIAIAIGHPHDVTLTALAQWLKTAERRGFELVPLSEAIRRKNAIETNRALALR